ncbi:hypothetical protein COO60DRAFT_1210744 [Scenedesmus sp. NREL 46B-D3]|nr:hypothetical protein COO60DRAFT_1210744 [Scenedesmus sp. NREL 46B-D3]
MLPEGNNTLYVCVADNDGAQACETTVVTVKKEENFRLSDAVSKFDVGQLAGANDVGVLAAGAAALQSMNAYVQQQATGDAALDGSDTSSTAADTAQKKKLQEEIDTKAGALISSLAGNADNLVSDPQSMQQVISAAAALSQTSSASSQETQSNLLSIAQAGLQSAQMSNKGVSSDQVSQILSIAAVGTGTTKKSDSSSTKGAGQGKTGRQLLSVAGPAVTAKTPAAWLGGMRQVLSMLPFSGRSRQLQEESAATEPAETVGSSAATTITGAAMISVMDQAAGLLLSQSTPASGLLSTGSQGLSVSVANLLGSTYAETPLAVGEALESAGGSSSNKAASTASPDNVVVQFSSPLLGVCQASDEDGGLGSTAADTSAGCTDSTVAVVLQYYQDATLLLNTEVVAALEAGSSSTNTTDSTDISTNTAADPLPDLELVSGAVVLAVTGANADEHLPCLNTTSNSSGARAALLEGCGAVLSLPITGELSSSKELVVLRVDTSGVPLPDGVLLGVNNGSTTSASQRRRLMADATTTAQVWTSKSGTFMLGQVTRASGEPVHTANDTAGSNETMPDNTTACDSATLDANVTGCDTTDVNSTISSNTTDADTTMTSNTTNPDTSPPGVNNTLSNNTQSVTNITAGSDTTSSTTVPGTNTTSNTSTPGNNGTSPGGNATTNTTGHTNLTSPATPPEQPAAAASPSPSPAPQPSPSPSPSPTPQQHLGSGTAGARDTIVALNLTFPMNFSELSSSQALLNTFGEDVAANIAKTLGINATLVEVVNIREGSVKCDVIVRVPASYTSSQVVGLQAAVNQLVAAPDAALADVKTKYNIQQAITAAVWEEPVGAVVADPGLAAVTAQLAKLVTISTGAIIISAVAVAVAITAVIAVVWWVRRRGRQAASQAFDANVVTAAGPGFPPAVPQGAARHHSGTPLRPESKGNWRLDELEPSNSAGSGGMIGTRTASEPKMQRPSGAPAPVVEVLLAPPGNAPGSSSGIGSCPSPRQHQQMQQLQQRASATLTSLATGAALPRSSAVLSQAPGSPVSPHAAARVARLPALPNEVLKRMQNASGSGASSSPRAADASTPPHQQHH